MKSIVMEIAFQAVPDEKDTIKLLNNIKNSCDKVGCNNVSMKVNLNILTFRFTIDDYTQYYGQHKLTLYITKAIKKCIPDNITGL